MSTWSFFSGHSSSSDPSTQSGSPSQRHSFVTQRPSLHLNHSSSLHWGSNPDAKTRSPKKIKSFMASPRGRELKRKNKVTQLGNLVSVWGERAPAKIAEKMQHLNLGSQNLLKYQNLTKNLSEML